MMQWEMVWTILGVMLGIFGAFSTLILWMMSRMENRLHADISGVSTRLDAHMLNSDAKWTAVNARIDLNQAIIMRMLEKQGK